MNRINKIDLHIQRLKILIARRKRIHSPVKDQLEKIEHLERCRVGRHIFAVALYDNEEYCKHCNLTKIKKSEERF